MKIFLLTLAILASTLVAKNPGIKIAIQQPILDKAKDTYFPEIINNILIAPIPDMDQGEMVLKNIQIQELNLDPKDIVVALYDGYVQLDAWNFSIVLTMVGEKQVFGVGFKTNLVASANQSNFFMKVVTNYTGDRLQFIVSEVFVNLQNADLRCDSFLAESEVQSMLESGEFKTLFAQTLQEQLRLQGEQTLNGLLESTPTNMEISGTPLSINYNLTGNLTVNSHAVVAPVQGDVYKTIEGMLSAEDLEAELPDIDLGSPHHVQVFISNAIVNSAITQIYSNNSFAFQLTNESLPTLEQLPFKLDTVSLAPLLPSLAEKYGEQPVYLNCFNNAEVPPKIQLTTGRIIALVDTTCEVFVWDGESDWVKGLAMESTLQIMASLGIVNEDHTLAITFERASISDVRAIDSEDAPSDALAPTVNILLDVFLPLTQFVPLPELPQFSLENAEIRTFDGFLGLYAYGDYKPLADYRPMPNSNAADLILQANNSWRLTAFLGFALSFMIALII